MSSAQQPPESPSPVEADDQVDRRGGRRVRLPIPVRLKIGGGSRPGRVRELSPVGLLVDAAPGDAAGQPVLAIFDGYPGISDAFVLHGQVARVVEGSDPGLAIEIDRQATPPDVLRQFRQLVLHFLHHKPLLTDLASGFFDGRCPECGWIGRVGLRKPLCPRCGHAVERPAGA